MLTARNGIVFCRTIPKRISCRPAPGATSRPKFGWQVERVPSGEYRRAGVVPPASALGLNVCLLPKGPVGPDWAALWPESTGYAGAGARIC